MPHAVHHFRPHLTEPKALEAISVARETLLQDVLARLTIWQPGASRQHFLLIGPRGIGKTHVLRLIEHRVRSSDDLARKWYPVCLPEEQYTITSLADLVLETLRHLGDSTGDPSLRAAHARLRFDPDPQRVKDLSLDALRQFCVSAHCGVLLMVENLNRLLEQQIKSRQEIESLRKVLIEEEWSLLIGTSPTFLDAVTQPEEPLFEFFQVKFLEELSPGDVELLLRKRATLENDADFLEYLRQYRSRLRALYHFSGGSPRLTLMLYDLLAHRAITDVRLELEALLDKLTPFYQDRMKELGPQEAKILQAMALLPEGVSPTELSRECRVTRAQVSALLTRLERAGYVRRESRDGKKSLYVIPERFFRIWHQMSHSRAARGRIQFLLEFFSTWYATPAERDEVWQSLLDQSQRGAQPGEGRRYEDVSEYMEYVAAVSEGDERLQRHFDLLRQLQAAGDADRVMSNLAELDGEFENDGGYFVRKGQFLAGELGRHDLALDAFERAAALRYSPLATLFNQGVALDKLGAKRKALSAYNEAARFLMTDLGLETLGAPTQVLLTVLGQGDRSGLVRIAAFLLGRTADRSVWREVVSILEKADVPWRRRHCATALGLLSAGEAVPLLTRCLKDSASEVRGSAATALGRIGSAEAVPPLLECLKDVDPINRGSAATALGRIGSAEAVPALLECLRDEASDVRGSAATALGRIGSPEAVPALLECLRDEASDVRGSAATALGRIGSAEAVPPLLECLKDEANNARGSAATALARIATPQALSGLLDAVPALVEAWTEGDERGVARGVNLLLRSAFRSGNLDLVRTLLEKICCHMPEGEALSVPHRAALDYLASGRAAAVLERQHPEVREAAEMLVSLFDEALKARPEPVRSDDDSPVHQP